MSGPAEYRIEVFSAKALIRMIFIGFWAEATANAFAVELDQVLDRLAKAGIKPGGFVFLADFRGSAIQSPVMVERFRGFAASAGTKARRVAVIAASALQKMQTQRMAEAYDHYGFFLPSQEAEAEAWLFAA